MSDFQQITSSDKHTYLHILLSNISFQPKDVLTYSEVGSTVQGRFGPWYILLGSVCVYSLIDSQLSLSNFRSAEIATTSQRVASNSA